MKKTVFGMAALAALTALMIAGCSKNDNDSSPEKMILGKWTPVSTKVDVINTLRGGSKTSYTPVYAGDYWDFRSDSKVYSYMSDPSEGPGYDPHDTLPYKFKNPYIIIGADTMAFGALTRDSLVLYLNESNDSLSWQTTYTLKK